MDISLAGSSKTTEFITTTTSNDAYHLILCKLTETIFFFP
jgi:hypothetical protein